MRVCFRAAVACLGALFEQLGRMLVGSFKDTLANLLKAMKSAEVCLLLSLFLFRNTNKLLFPPERERNACTDTHRPPQSHNAPQRAKREKMPAGVFFSN